MDCCAAFVLCASCAVAKCVACVSACVREETGNQRPVHSEFSACAKRPKTAAVSHRKHMDLTPCALNHVLAKRLLRSRAARWINAYRNAAFSPWGHTWIAIQAREDMDLNHDQQTSSCDKKMLRSRAAGTLGSHSVRNETSSCDKAVAYSRRKHTWIPFRAQKDMFLRKDCGDLAPPPI